MAGNFKLNTIEEKRVAPVPSNPPRRIQKIGVLRNQKTGNSIVSTQENRIGDRLNSDNTPSEFSTPIGGKQPVRTRANKAIPVNDKTKINENTGFTYNKYNFNASFQQGATLLEEQKVFQFSKLQKIAKGNARPKRFEGFFN